MLKKKMWANFQRIIEVFSQEIVTKLSKIQVWVGSGIRKKPIPDPGSPILDPGVKKAPDPGSRIWIRNAAYNRWEGTCRLVQFLLHVNKMAYMI